MSDTATRDAEALRETIRTETAAAQTAKASADTMTEAEKAKGFDIASPTAENRETFDRIDAAYKVADTHAENAAEARRRLDRITKNEGHSAASRADGDISHPAAIAHLASLGAKVVASAGHQKFLASGQIHLSTGKVDYDPVQVLSKEQTRQFLATGSFRAAVGDGDPLIPTDERLAPVMIPKRALSLLDLINVQSTGRDSVTWVRQTARNTAAVMQRPFGTALNPSDYTFERVPAPVIRKGHYAIVDEGNLEDADEFRGIVDGELVSDLRLKMESDALTAVGGSDWTGIYATAGLGAFDGTGVSRPDALHKSLTLVRVAMEREPNAVGISPTDFEDFYLEKGSDGHYLHHRGPVEGDVPTVWGKSTAVSTIFTKPLVGDYKAGATLWVRDGVAIVVGRIDDQLLEGLWTIRAQARGAFAVKQPKAFATVENYGA